MFQWLNFLGGSSLSSIADFHLTLTDVNDNPPRLVKEYTGLFLCYPLQAPGSLIFEATDDDQVSFRGLHFTFSLGSESLQNDWEVTKINGEFSKVYGGEQMDDEISFYLLLCVCRTQRRASFFHAPGERFMLWKPAQGSCLERRSPGLWREERLTHSIPLV